MTAALPDLGDLLDLAKAIGLVKADGSLNPDWFADPGKFTGQMLRVPVQRQALLRSLDSLLGEDAELFLDDKGRSWVPVIRHGGVALHLVVESAAGATVVGVGARLTTTAPVSMTDVLVPLVRIPDDGSAVKPVPGTALGRVQARSEVRLDGAAPAPGKAGMSGLMFALDVAADGSDPKLSMVIRSLQLPGEKAPHDLVVDGTGSSAALSDQAVKLVVGVVQGAANSATGPLAELLALVGLTSDPAVPALPVAGILQRGLVAWREWLSELVSRPGALQAWLGHLAALISAGLPSGSSARPGATGPVAVAGAGPTVEPPTTPGGPHRIAWTVANGLSVAATIRVGATTGGAPEIDLGVQATAEKTGNPPGGVELDAVLARITLGATPSVRALPRLTLLGRAGPAAGGVRLLDVTTPQVGATPPHPVRARSLRAGFALDAGRRPVFVLAAHDVTIAAHSYPVLDLTNTQTLAEVGQAALGDIADDLLGRLGAAEVPVRVLLGLSAPPGQSAWPVPLTTLPDLLGNPVAAVAEYHRRVLTTDRAGYVQVLAPLGALLLAPAGGPVEAVAPAAVGSAAGPGDRDQPWRFPLADGVALTVWADAELHVGVLVDRSVVDLGGGCPTAALTLRADVASVRLATRSARIFTDVSARLRLGGRGGVPLRMGDEDAALVTPSIGLDLRWSAGGPLRAVLAAPDLVAEVGTRREPIELPTVAADGSLTGTPPWRALELLSGNLLRRAGASWATTTADLLGWAAPIGVGPVTPARLPLETLVADPVRAARDWVLGTETAAFAGWLATLLAGPAGGGIGPAPGRGDVDSPHAVPVNPATAAAVRSARVLLWNRAGVAPRVAPFRPGPLLGWLTAPPGSGTAPTGEQLAAALQLAAAAGPRAGELLEGRTALAAGLSAVQTRWTDSDGLTPASAATLPKATAHDLDGVAHGRLPGRVDLAALGIPAAATAVFVTGPFGPPTWPGIPDHHLLDLAAPGLPAEAFDVTAVATTDGPWAVRLPRRADAVTAPDDDGFARQTARLARVVDAAVARAAGKPVALVGFGAAGHAAAAAAARPGVTHLVTVGTPHGGLDLDILDAAAGGDALRMLVAMLPPADPDRPEHPGVVLGRSLLVPLTDAFDIGDPLADLAPPATPPGIPTTVTVHCLRGRVTAEGASKALTGLIVRGLQQFYETGADPVRDPVPGAPSIGWALALRTAPATAADTVRVRGELALTLPGPGTAPGAGRGLRVRFVAARVGGWLVGGPTPGRPAGPRGPALRRATLELVLPFATGAAPTSRILLDEGSALGVRRTRWELTSQGEPMTAEARTLVAALAAALGPLPASGPVRNLVDLLVALGVTEPGTSQVTGAPVAVSVEGVRRFLIDPGALLRDAPPTALAAALARITGATPPATTTPARFGFDVDGLSVTADIAARTVRVQTSSTGLPFTAGAVLRGFVEATGGGAQAGFLAGSAELTLGAGLTLQVGTTPQPSARLVLADGGGSDGRSGSLPAAVTLYPQPDGAALRRLVAAVAPAQVLWAGIMFLRSLQQAGVDAVMDPLLRALNLLRPDGRVLLPLTLLSAPDRWFARLGAGKSGKAAAATGGGPPPDAFAAAFDALGALLGVPSVRPGTWQLPYGLQLSVVTAGAPGPTGRRVALTVAIPTAPPTDLPVTASASLVAGGGRPPDPQASLTIATPGATGRLTFTAGANGATGRLQVPSLPLDVAVLPPGPGLAGDVGQDVLRALPHVLDALADLPSSSPGFPIGQAVRTLGERLGLRVANAFRADQLAALGADPGSQLVARLTANLPLGLAALRDLLAPMLPPFLALTATGSALTLARTGQTSFTLALSVPSAAGVRVAGSLTGRRPFPGATLDADAAVDAAGLSVAHAVLDVPAGKPLTFGPLRLAPRIDVAAGPAAAGGPHLAVGLGSPASVVSGVLRAGPPRTFAVEASGGLSIPDAVVRLLLPIAADLALSTAELQSLLTRPASGTTVKNLLDGVVLSGGIRDPAAFEPGTAFGRLLRLGANLGGAPKAPTLNVAPLVVTLAKRTVGATTFLGLSVTLPPGQRFDLVTGDITVQAEVDGTWVLPAGQPQGLTVEVLRVPSGGQPAPSILVALRGIGIRIGRRGGPLLDGFAVVDSVAAHGLIEVGDTTVTAAGGQLELAGLRLPVGSAKGGNNQVASGVLRDSASGTEGLAPKFSPALAVQRRDKDLKVHLRAGDGDGPWFIPIQRGFGPVYVEQVGFGVTRKGDRVTDARIVVDGRVELLGLLVAVQELGLTAPWPQAPGKPAVTDPTTWSIGLEGLAVAASTGGLSISGGLRRTVPGAPDYEGMISLRFGPYGLTAYGGYGVLSDAQGNFTSLFIYGALNAPIGGPPAFFLTGIGAGIGVNRLLKLPPSLAELPAYPLVQALDPNSPVAQQPLEAITALRTFFPPERGAFWFAAGVSFTSFALVDCVAVLAVAVADGLEITLLGLARAALPTPAAPLAQLELALLVRFSSRDGVLWVQAQLTDNSWLLTKDIRLTGGFAYVSWFSGDKAGEFVLTVGGFHPSFHRNGYPVVPRVGYRWGVGKFLVIKGETYFAITSEAIMAGTRLEASLTLGPLWAYLRLGADGIVFFDPFRFEVTAFAELGAGITIDIDLGFAHIRLTIAFHLHAEVTLAGPNFHGTATIDLGVASATIAFGDPSGPPALPLPWEAFSAKYLQAGNAPVITAVAGRGQLPPSTAGTKAAPTGEADDPFLMLPEFELMVTTTAATTQVTAAGAGTVAVPGADPLAIGPMQIAAITSTLTISVTSVAAGTQHAPKFVRPAMTGQVPKGVWGPQSDDKPLPTGETLTAGTGVRLVAQVSFGPQVAALKYHQVEIGPRKPNPLLAALAGPPPGLLQRVSSEVPRQIAAADTATAVFDVAQRWLQTGPGGRQLTPTATALFRSRRSAPPRLVPPTREHGAPPPTRVSVPVSRPADPDAAATRRNDSSRVRTRPSSAAPVPSAPSVRAVLTLAPSATARPRPRTTIGSAGTAFTRVSPPMGDALAATRDRLDPRLRADLEVRPARVSPGWDGPGNELRRGIGIGPQARTALDARSRAVTDGGLEVPAGELVVLDVPGAERDDDTGRRPRLVVDDGSVRIVALDTTGAVVLDRSVDITGSDGAGGDVGAPSVALPVRTARVALIGGGAAPTTGAGAAGWSAASTLAQLGGRAMVGPGCSVESTAVATRRNGRPVTNGFVRAAAAVAGFSVVTTRLPASTRSVVIAVERDDPLPPAWTIAAGRPAEPDLTLELGIAGASTVGDPRSVDARGRAGSGEGTTVYPVAPDPGAEHVTVTVATGRDLHLAGVLGSDLEAADTARLLDGRGLAELLGVLVPHPDGGGRVRWIGAAESGEVRR